MQVNVSVIIPFYNVSMYIDNCVKTLSEQTLKGIEFLFIDDCSTDDSLSVLECAVASYFKDTAQVKVIKHDRNRGVSSARNTGLANASGTFIGWTDADDNIEANMFELLYNRAIEVGADIVWCDFYNSYLDRADRISQLYLEDPLVCVKGLIKGELMGALWNKLVRRSLFEKNQIHFPDGLNMCEDLRVSVQLYHSAKKVSYLPQSLYHYIKHRSNSISVRSVNSTSVNLEWVENVKGIVRFLKEEKMQGISSDLMLLKLRPKNNLLVHGRNLTSFNQWTQIFPEANHFIWKTKLPLYYKILAAFAMKNIMFPIKCALFIKYKLFKRS